MKFRDYHKKNLFVKIRNIIYCVFLKVSFSFSNITISIISFYKNFVQCNIRFNEFYDVDAHMFLVNFVDLGYFSATFSENKCHVREISATYVSKEKKM